MEVDWDSGLRKALLNSRIFSNISENLLEDLMSTVEIRTVLGGSIVFAQGDVSDSMVVLVSGRLTARLSLDDGTYKTLSQISPGSSAGELGLILQQPRAATVAAVRDSCIAILSRAHFEVLLRKHPVDINRAITRMMLEYNTSLKKTVKNVGATVITIVQLEQSPEIKSLSKEIAKQIEVFGRVMVRDSSAISLNDSGREWNGFVHEMEQDFDYILLETNNEDSVWSRLTSRQADHIIFIATSHDGETQKTISRVFREGNMASEIRKSLICAHPNEAQIPNVDQEWVDYFKGEHIYPVRVGNQHDIARVCRFVTDNAVGLVLGGGGARGMAHVGVLRALEDEGIPVDIICGNSMGALIGGQYAIGVSSAELIPKTQKFIASGDLPTFPLFSLLSGKKIAKNIKSMFLGHKIGAMWRPFYCVSCNLSKAEIHLHQEGELWSAILASNSPAGILPPVIKNGNLFVDAALLDNVPVESLRNRLCSGTIIAVDVDVNEELTVSNKVKGFEVLQHIRRWFFRDERESLPGIIDILNRAGHLGGLNRRKHVIAMADHYLQPPVSQFGLMAYKRADEIAKTAYEYTIEQIKTWPKVRLSSRQE